MAKSVAMGANIGILYSEMTFSTGVMELMNSAENMGEGSDFILSILVIYGP